MRETLKGAALSAGIELSHQQLDAFETYAALLREWNERMNLTAITDPKEIAIKHFVDSLAGQSCIRDILAKQGTCSLIDVGSGAGFPGVPLKILFPKLQVTLLDSLNKRINFLNEVIKELQLTGISCVHERAEEGAHKPEFREKFDVAVARAVAPLPVLLEYLAGYVKPSGKILAYKGPSLTEEMETSGHAMKVLKLKKEDILSAKGIESMDHFVAVFEKQTALPLQYPRKQSKIKATPL